MSFFLGLFFWIGDQLAAEHAKISNWMPFYQEQQVIRIQKRKLENEIGEEEEKKDNQQLFKSL